MGGTLENRYQTKIKHLEGDTDAQVEYMLQTVPFIREYFTEEKVENQLVSGFVHVTGKTNRNEVLQRYMAEVEGDLTAAKLDKMCTNDTCECGGRVVFDARESALVCTTCGTSRPHMEMSDANMTFDQEQAQKIVTYCSYKRSNHFSEWINALMGRETTPIPDEIVAAVKAEFKKARTAKTSDITPAAVRAYLRKLKLNKYYEHTHSICAALNGVPAPVMSAQLEETLKNMFQQIQEPFDKWVHHVDPTRKNMLSYSYCLYKFCELLGEDDYLVYFNLLKSNEKLYKMDMIWKKICGELQWEYIPSV